MLNVDPMYICTCSCDIYVYNYPYAYVILHYTVSLDWHGSHTRFTMHMWDTTTSAYAYHAIVLYIN